MKKKVLLFALLFTAIKGSAQYNGDTVLQYNSMKPIFFDILHTRLSLLVDWEKEQLISTAELRLKPYIRTQQKLILDAKNFKIRGCFLKTKNIWKELPYSYDGFLLQIDLLKKFSAQDTLDIKIDYIANYESNKRTTQVGLYFFKPYTPKNTTSDIQYYQVWTQGEPNGASYWFPTFDQPNEKCTQEVIITVDSFFHTISNGVLLSSTKKGKYKTDHWNMEYPHSPYLFALVIGKFSFSQQKWNDVTLRYISSFPHRGKDIFFKETPQMLSLFNNLLHYTYPYPKYDQVIVKNFIDEGMENTTITILSEDYDLEKKELIDEKHDNIIAHELFHQWFGNLVTCKSWAYLPLNEGFATYGEYLWYEHKYGKNEANRWLYQAKNTHFIETESLKRPVINYYYTDTKELFDTYSYQKSAIIIHMLRNFLGDTVFFQSLHHYLINNKYKSVDLDNLRHSFETTAGEDLKWFFDQWFLREENPKINVLHEHKNDSLFIAFYQELDSPKKEPFIIPIEVNYWIKEEQKKIQLVLETEYLEIAIPLSEKPSLVQVDPNGSLLVDFYHEKSHLETLNQYKFAVSYSMKVDALASLANAPKELFLEAIELALEDSFHHIKIEALALIKDTNIKKYPNILKKIISLTKDKNSLVRASALSTLSSYNIEQQIFEKALADSSYSVVGQAIDALLENKTQIPTPLEPFKNIDNIQISIPFAQFFIRNYKQDELKWFINTLLKQTGIKKTHFLSYFIQYIATDTKKRTDEVLHLLTFLATKDNQEENKIFAFQGITLFDAHKKEIQKLISSLIENESTLHIKEAFQSILNEQ
ncbi:MAG: M1 family metallopeptidase [Chitinophagaceae bacterium]|nr:M1 family metallopeptidase [Chitinophagaceae bacterium]